jgi:SAM-dependent methyltransferase
MIGVRPGVIRRGGGSDMDPMAWRQERRSLAESFDRVADLYAAAFAGKLTRKPFDMGLFARMAKALPSRKPILEVGAGPAQVSAYLAGLGQSCIASDASLAQLRHARRLNPSLPAMQTDLAFLPVMNSSLSGIVAYYCLMYGPPEQLDHVFAGWCAALEPGGLAVIAVHCGKGVIHAADWEGRKLGITLVLRDPADLASRMNIAGFQVEELTIRPPYPDERPTKRLYVMARRGRAARDGM